MTLWAYLISIILVSALLAGCLAQSTVHHPTGDPYVPLEARGVTRPTFAANIDKKLNGADEIDPLLGSGTARVAGSICTSNGRDIDGNFNPKCPIFGAVADGFHDDSPAFQAAIDAACNYEEKPPATVPTVYFPVPGPGHSGGYPAVYNLGKPLFLHCNNLHFEGPSASIMAAGKGFLSANFGGWTLILSQLTYGAGLPVVGVDLDTPIITGSMHSGKFDQVNDAIYLNFGGDMSMMDQRMNGLTALDAESYIKLAATTNGNILSSSGNLYHGATEFDAYQLHVASDHACAVFTTTDQGKVSLCGTTAVTTGAVHDLYASADLKDKHCRVMLDGKLEALATCTGSIVQQPWEIQAVGQKINQDAPDGVGDVAENPIIGDLDGVVMSAEIRHSTSSRTIGATIYTPTNAEPRTDANTLLYISFDTNLNMLTRVFGQAAPYTASQGYSWLYPRRSLHQPDGSIQLSDVATYGIQLSNVSLQAATTRQSNGIIGMGVIAAIVEDVGIHHVNWGINLSDSSFANVLRNISVDDSGVAGINIGQASSENYIDNAFVGGQYFGITSRTGGTSINVHYQASANTVWAFAWQPNNDNYVNATCITCEDDNEGFTPVFQADVLLDGIPSIAFVSGAFGVTDQTAGGFIRPAVIVHSAINVKFDSTYFYNHSNSSGQDHEIIRFASAPVQPVIMSNVRQQNISDVDAWSSTLQYLTFPGCSGQTILDETGAGRITAQCITGVSDCSTIDVTNRAHTFTAAAPAISGSPLNGNVAITGGAGGDMIRTTCK